ncbi:MAG: hypothetical protein ACOY82_00750 [Pseudomonadota bacterium]
MHRCSIHVGIALALIVGCTDTASSAAVGPDKGVPPSTLVNPTSVARNCRAEMGVDYPAYARTIGILERSGEIGRAKTHFAATRASLQEMLLARNPGAAAELALVLDPIFSDAAVRKRAVCDFTRHSRDEATVDAWEAWASDAKLLDIHRRIVGDAPAGAPAGPRIAGARRASLLRLWTATGRFDFSASRAISRTHARMLVEHALDPGVRDMPTYQVPAPAPETEEAGVERLGVLLARVPDRDLERFLAFAESGPGKAYYRSLAATYTDAMIDWYGHLSAETRTKIAPRVVAMDGDALAGQLAEIRNTLDTVRDFQKLYAVRDKLANLELRDRDNAELLTLRGRVELTLTAHLDQFNPPRDKGQIREPAGQAGPYASVYDRPEPFLESAIERAPDRAEPRAFLGLLRFLQHRDAEAAALFAEARRLDADDPYLAAFEGDLAYAGGRYADAERRYRDALAKAGPRAVLRDRVVRHLGFALEAQGRGDEYAAIAAEALRQQPDLWELRLDLADDLMDRRGTAAEAEAVLVQIPKSWEPDRVAPIRSRLVVQRVIEAAPAQRVEVAKAEWKTAVYDSEAIGKALCRARDRTVLPAVLAAREGADMRPHIGRAMLGCAVLSRRSEVVADALPLMADVNEPLNALWQETALCGAAARGDVRTLTLLLKAKADPGRPCSGGKTVQERLAERAAGGDAAAREALATFQRLTGTK